MRKARLAGVSALICALFCCGGTAWAQGSRKDDVVFNAEGRPMAGATVRICTADATGEPCAPLANIYSNAALTQALANPITTDGLGNYSFYAKPGRYMVEISGPGITTKQIPDVILPNDPSAPTFTALTTTSGISAFSLTLSGDLTVDGNTAVNGTLTVGTPGGSITATQLTPAGTSGDCAQWGTGGALADAGAPCGSGGGGAAWASTNDAVQYGSKNSTAGSGLSLGSPQPYLSNLFNSLPSTGGEMDVFGAYGTGSGPVTLDSSCTTLAFLATGDPNYASPPSCMHQTKPFTVLGRGGTSGTQTGWQAPSGQIAGCAATAGTPCLILQGYAHAIKGINIQYPSTAVQIGGSSDGSSAVVATANTVLKDFSASNYNSPGDAAFGPTVSIKGSTLWTRISDSSIGANRAAPVLSPLLRSAILINPGSGYSELNVFDHLTTYNGGGTYIRGGSGGTSSLYVNHMEEEGTTDCMAPVTAEEGYGYLGKVVGNDLGYADCSHIPPVASFAHQGTPARYVIANSVGVVEGSATLLGNSGDYLTDKVLQNFGVPVARVYPSGKNDKGLWLGHVLSDVADVWRSGVPQIVQFAQQSQVDWTSGDWSLSTSGTGTGLAVSAVTDPWGQTGMGDAWQVSCTATGTYGCTAVMANVTTSWTAGDYVILSALVKPGSDAGFPTGLTSGAWSLLFNYGDSPHMRFIAGSYGASANETLPISQTDGHWQRIWAVAQVTKPGSFHWWATLGTDPSHPVEYAAPMYLKIPAGTLPAEPSCTIAASPSGLVESGNTVMVTTTASCPVTLGQPFIISGVAAGGGWNSYEVQDAFSSTNNNTDAEQGLFVVTSVTDSTHFTFYDPSASLAASGGGTITFNNDSEAAEIARTLDFYPPSCTAGQRCDARGAAPDLGAAQTWTAANAVTGSITPSGSGTITATSITPAGTAGNCVEWGSGGTLADAGAACGTATSVTSVFGRTGAVTAASGDYTAAQVTNAFDSSANNDIGAHYLDVGTLTAPASPAAGSLRIYADSSTGKLACKDSSGTDCMPSAGGSGTVTTTGSPASGNLAKFSSSMSVTNADLTGDATTSGTTAVTVSKINGTSFSGQQNNLVSFGAGGNTPEDSGVSLSQVPNVGNFRIVEEFCGGLSTEGTIGGLGWFSDLGSGASIVRDSHSAPDANHPCNVSFNTGASAGSQSETYLAYCGDTSASPSCGAPGTPYDTLPELDNRAFTSTCVFKLVTVNSSSDYACGFFHWGNGHGAPAEGGVYDNIVVRYIPSLGDSKMTFAACDDAGTCTTSATNSITPVAGDWIKAQIRSTTAGTILFSICQAAPPNGCTLGAETSISTHVPTTGMTPTFGTNAESTTAQTLVIDYFDFSTTVNR